MLAKIEPFVCFCSFLALRFYLRNITIFKLQLDQDRRSALKTLNIAYCSILLLTGIFPNPSLSSFIIFLFDGCFPVNCLTLEIK